MPPVTRNARSANPSVDPAALPWHVLAAPGDGGQRERVLRSRTVYVQVLALTVLVVVGVSLLGSFAARRIAEREAVNDAANEANILAQAVVQPALRNGLATGQAGALATLDSAVREQLLSSGVVRFKLWAPDGTIVYSDESRLIGQQFDLGADEQEVLRDPATQADVTDLEEPENLYERGQGKLLEVYRPVTTPDGERLLFEIYLPYDDVVSRSSAIWRGFAGITISSLLALVVLMLPVLWRVLDRLRRGQAQRAELLQQALDASNDERRRIAATLHDGVVQELAATSFVVSGAAARARAVDRPELGAALDDAATAVRGGITGLRTLLVDIYPPSLDATGLVPALTDLVEGYRSSHVEVLLEPVAGELPQLSRSGERLVFQVAQETLRNAVRHGAASRVRLRVEPTARGLGLTVDDDGDGFDVDAVLANPETGHFGIRLLSDAARHAGADLRVASVRGTGTTWRLEVDR